LDIFADLDLQRLVISPDTFVTEALRKIYSDVIYSDLYYKAGRHCYADCQSNCQFA